MVNTICYEAKQSGGVDASGVWGNVPTSGGAFLLHLCTPGHYSAHQAKAHGTCTLLKNLPKAQLGLDLLTSRGCVWWPPEGLKGCEGVPGGGLGAIAGVVKQQLLLLTPASST